MVSRDEVKSYTRIANDDDNLLIDSLISVADEYLKGSIGKDYDSDSERAKMLSLMIVSDLFENRGINEQPSTKVREIVNSFSQQMRLEMRTNDD